MMSHMVSKHACWRTVAKVSSGLEVIPSIQLLERLWRWEESDPFFQPWNGKLVQLHNARQAIQHMHTHVQDHDAWISACMVNPEM